MDGFSFTDPAFLITVLLGGLFFCGISALFSYFESKDEQPRLNKKGLLRDVILGCIFTSMAWNIIPDSMKSFGNGITNIFGGITNPSAMSGGSASASASSASASASTSASSASASASGSDFDIQVGPASF